MRSSFWQFLVALLAFVFEVSAEPDATKETASSPNHHQTNENVSFVAYNLKNYLRMDRRIDGELRENHQKPKSEIQAMLEAMGDLKPDVLGICEIGTEADLKDLIAQLKSIDLDYPHYEYLGGIDPHRSLAILSRYPISARNSQRALTFPIAGAKEALRRGLLDVTIRFNRDYHVRFLGIHFKSKRESRRFDQAEMRRYESKVVRDYATKLLKADPKLNLCLYGDFNDTRDAISLTSMKKFGSAVQLTDLNFADTSGYRWTHYWSQADVYARIDYIFTSSGFYPEIDQEKNLIHAWPSWFTASDHRPLRMVFQAREKGTPGE